MPTHDVLSLYQSGRYRFYHGTHSGNLKKIEAEGLAPQADPGGAMRGNLSTIPGITEHLVFLAPCAEEAAYYAVAQAERAGTEPVIFEVIVEGEEFLRASDDYIGSVATNAMLAASGLKPLEFDEDGDVHEYGDSTPAYLAWREIFAAHITELTQGAPFNKGGVCVLSEDEIDMLIDAHGDAVPRSAEGSVQEKVLELAGNVWEAAAAAYTSAPDHDWRLSIATDRDPSVGYRGVIAPDCLTRLDADALAEAIANRSRGHGFPVVWELDAPLAPAKRARLG